jgi:hypothetical protein
VKVWITPAKHMKVSKEHSVPLCARALTIPDEMSGGHDPNEQFVFRGGRRVKPLGNMSMAVTHDEWVAII